MGFLRLFTLIQSVLELQTIYLFIYLFNLEIFYVRKKFKKIKHDKTAKIKFKIK